jgi:hypothetical protein
MLLSPYIDDKKTLHFDMMGYNRSKPDDERNPESLSVRGCRQIFEGAYICTVNHKVQILFGILNSFWILQRVNFLMKIIATSLIKNLIMQ